MEQPDSLSEAGRSLWDAVTSRFDVDAHEAALLREAARTADAIDGLEAALQETGLVVDGKPSPLLVELRQQRIVLTRLVASLRIPEEGLDGWSRAQRRGGARGAYLKGVS